MKREQHIYYVLSRQAVKPVSMGRAGEKTWRVSFLSKEDLLAFVRARPCLAIDKYIVNIKKEVFHYEVRIPPVLGFAEVMGWFKSKYVETDIISVQPVIIDGIYSNVTRISMKKRITEEMRIPCGVGQAKCYVTAKTNLWADFPPISRAWSAPAAAVNNITTDARVVR